MVSPLARRSAVKYLVKQMGSSQRRACVVVGLSRSLVRYIARRRRDEAKLIKKIHELAIRHSRYGYRRITVLLRREGFKVNRKRVHRIWKSEGLGLPQRRPKRRRMGSVGEIINKAEYPNHVWSYDFVEDRTERGGKLRILAIIDEYTRECLAIRIAASIPASAVVGVLEWLFLTRGVPKFLRSDNGPEFVAKAVCRWLKESGCSSLFIKPGSPWENGYIESFNDKLRDECLNREIFRNGKEAQTIVEAWREEYNNYRPHSSLDYLTPAEFARRYYEKNWVTEVKQPVEKAGSLSL
ncbi:MAG: IS3 family transposase [Chloroflexota bacterium]|nr:IS3 family transposase [Chloroflexota bacterium]